MNGQQLKNSILQMAVQGKLVPQDPNDEPASVLLERIRKEKEKLIKEGKIKKEKNPSYIFRGADNLPYEKIGKNDPVCIADEIPFDVPESWEWIRLGALTYNHGQTTPTTEFSYIDIGSIDNQNQKLNTDENIVPSEKAPSRARKIVEYGDILYSTVRPYLHNMCIVDRAFSKMPIASTGFAVLTCHAEFVNEFLFYYMMAPDFDNYANNTDNAKGVAYPAINDTRLYQALIPVPPVAEQLRIISAFKSILPYIDDYRNAETQLSDLNSSFPEHLKKSILQWAVQGKLVPQDPSDEPAEALLGRIRVEKRRLIKEGKIKKDKHESVIFRRDNSHYEKLDGVERCIDDELPFEIPESWAWVRLGTVLEIARGGSPRPIQQYLTTESNGVNWIKIGDADKGGKYIYKTKEKICPEGVTKSRMVHSGDFLLTNSMSFGRPYILKTDGCIHDGWLVLSNRFECYSVDFLYYILSSPFAYYQFCDSVSGAVVKNLNSDKVANALFPLPPLSEQCRIIQRIEKLLPLVKRL